MNRFKNFLGFCGIFLIFVFAFSAPKEPENITLDNLEEFTSSQNEPTFPVKIEINAINVNALIEPVGLNGEAMDTPLFAFTVGWYKLGVKPGEIGTAVIDGHVNWKKGEKAVFTNLKDIRINDIVKVLDNEGNIQYFIVRDFKRYSVNSNTDEIFSSDDGLAHLNLITCDGSWNSKLGTHNERLVVFTDKI